MRKKGGGRKGERREEGKEERPFCSRAVSNSISFFSIKGRVFLEEEFQ